MKKVFLSTEIIEDKTAASKAKVDVLDILQEEGYHSVYFPNTWKLSRLAKFWNELSGLVEKGSHVVLEYPCIPRRRIYVIYLFCLLKRIKLFGVIHDISELRFPEQKQVSDLHFLKLFNGLISHNSLMTDWLRKRGYKGKVVELYAFDYLLDKPKNYHALTFQPPYKLFYAGNLSYSKATYVYDKKLSAVDQMELHLYGQHFEKERINGSKVNYMGAFKPNTPELKDNYHFGLIWEGTSLDTCDGQFGNYIKYNNPHKFSLYLSLGLPVIVWKKAAVARFVEHNNIGFTIDSFHELGKITEKVSPEQYAEYVSNIGSLADKVREGFFLKAALERLTKA